MFLKVLIDFCILFHVCHADPPYANDFKDIEQSWALATTVATP